MHVLVLSPYPPYPPRSGGSLRIYHLLRELSRRHRVTLLTFADAAAVPALAPLREWLTLVTVPSPAPRSLVQRALTTLFSPLPDMALRNADGVYREQLRRLLAEQHFDAVQAESIEMADYLAIARRAGLPTVLDQFNAEALLQWRTARQDLSRPWARRGMALVGGVYSMLQALKLRRYERRVVSAASRVLTVSHEDRDELLRLAPRARLSLVYNGVDCSYLSPRSVQPANHELVFAASLNYRPNVDALRWFVAEVLPHISAVLPTVRLRIIGRRPSPAVQQLHDGRRVIVVGEVADVRGDLLQAAVSIIPMRIGGGSRLKLFEALALAMPVVSTSLGAMGLPGLKDGHHLRIADRAVPFAAAVVELLNDRSRAAQLGRAGRAYVAATYDWQAIGPSLLAVYEQLAV